jgi:dihydroorotase
MFDFLIKHGRVIDPSQNIDSVQDLAIDNGRIVSLAGSISTEQARETIDADGLIITPGLIDLHVHVYEGVSIYGIDADKYCLEKGVTTAVDAGSSGAQTFPGFRKYIVEKSRTRVLAFLNLSVLGMITKRAGELENISYADTEAAIRTIESNRDVIVGIKVRMEKLFHGKNGWRILELAREVSQATQLPVMYHIAHTDPPIRDILRVARKGDIITHCFHSKKPGGLLDKRGKILPELSEAIAKGVYLDIGHGKASFSFQIARQALDQGVMPSTISTDLHINNIAGPVYSLPTTMLKFLYLGLSLYDVIAMTTLNPAQILGREDRIGSLKPGRIADITILQLVDEVTLIEDAEGDLPIERIKMGQRLTCAGVFRNGQLIFLRKY